MILELHLLLKSAATFGRGDGVVGVVDEEVEHDTATGLPFLRGRTLKGLLVEECANILFTLAEQQSPAQQTLQDTAMFLFGQGGSTRDDDAKMYVGAAMLPKALRDAVEADIQSEPPRLQPAEVLESLTAIRRQTAVDTAAGTPVKGSLRSMRVILRDTLFIAPLDFNTSPPDTALALLAACVLSLRRAGTGRNRGRGRLQASLHNPTLAPASTDVTITYFRLFQDLIRRSGRSA